MRLSEVRVELAAVDAAGETPGLLTAGNFSK
jgi:hypothetical protein